MKWLQRLWPILRPIRAAPLARLIPRNVRRVTPLSTRFWLGSGDFCVMDSQLRLSKSPSIRTSHLRRWTRSPWRSEPLISWCRGQCNALTIQRFNKLHLSFSFALLSLLFRSTSLHLNQFRAYLVIGVTQRFDQQHAEQGHGQQQCRADREVM